MHMVKYPLLDSCAMDVFHLFFITEKMAKSQKSHLDSNLLHSLDHRVILAFGVTL